MDKTPYPDDVPESEQPTMNINELPLEVRVASELGLKTRHAELFLQVAFENAKLFDRKQQDYGPHNIIGFGLLGILVRMNDKFERLKTLMGKKKGKVQNESIRDTFQDISNYAIIATMVDTKRWPTS
jgi:hypothetical protein